MPDENENPAGRNNNWLDLMLSSAIVVGGAKPAPNGGENALLWGRLRSHPTQAYCPFATSRRRVLVSKILLGSSYAYMPGAVVSAAGAGF